MQTEKGNECYTLKIKVSKKKWNLVCLGLVDKI